MHEGFKTVV